MEKSKKTRLLKTSIFEDRLVDDMTVEEYIEKRSEESRLNLVYQLMSEKKSLNDMFKDRVSRRIFRSQRGCRVSPELKLLRMLIRIRKRYMPKS